MTSSSNLRKNTLVAAILCFVLILLWETTSSSYKIKSTFEEVQFDPDYQEPNFDEPEDIIAKVPKNSKSRELEYQKQVFEHKVEDEKLKTDETQQDLPSPVVEKQNPRTKVLLITAHRSGSTFLGELFNRNNDAFYLFEPLAAVQGPHSTDMCDGLVEEKNSYLRKAFECRLPVVYRQKGSEFTYGGETYDKLPLGAIKEASPFRGKCSGKNLCFRENHRWACDSGLCNGKEPTGLVQNNCQRCRPLEYDTMDNVCQNRPITALKVIRYCDLNALNTLPNQESIKKIVLFRDPRGIFVSRLKIFRNEKQAIETTKKTCRHFYEAIKMVSDKSIFFLRYEDMSSDPLSMAKKIYEFINQVISDELVGWIVESQKISAQSGGTYSTVRNSTATMTAWRKNISYQNLVQVQDHCQDFMKLAGYTSVTKESELTDEKVPVFTEWSP